MAIPRSRLATFARQGSGNRLVARDLEFCSRINRTEPAGDYWRGRLDHQEMVTGELHGSRKNRLGRSLASKFGSRISQHRSAARLVLQRHARQTRRGMEQQFSAGKRDARSARQYSRVRARPRRRLLSRSTSTLCYQLGLDRARQPRLPRHGRPVRNLQQRSRQIPLQTTPGHEPRRPRMTRRRTEQEPKGPTISLAEGKRRLEAMRTKGVAMLQSRPLSESAVDTWANTTIDYIRQTFGENSAHILTFIGHRRVRVIQGTPRYDSYAEQEDAKRMEERIGVLGNLIELIDQEISFSAPTIPPSAEEFWSRLHPSVTQVAKPRFDSAHYADAVEAAFKELNSKIKAYMKRATGEEYDGADLMQRAFSPNSPIVRLADLSTDDGRNILLGYK